MKKPLVTFPLLILVYILVSITPDAMAQINVLPAPKFVAQESGETRFAYLDPQFTAGAKDEASVRELGKYFGANIMVHREEKISTIMLDAALLQDPSKMGNTFPAGVTDSAFSVEGGYFLVIGKNKIELRAKTTTGIFYGVATLLQLLKKEKSGYVLPDVRIADYPSLKFRGISDDISRGQISTMENLRKIIRFIAMYKMNVYMPYIENLFAFSKYPDFSKGRDPLTPAQVSELDSYAAIYHVQIIPAFETLGHMEDALYKEQFQKYAEFPGATCIDISSDSAIDFVKSLLSEIAPAFSSKYFNMAGDETFDVGLGASKALVDSLGLAKAEADYYTKILKYLQSLGKTVMMYGDIPLEHPEILVGIPKNAIIVDWHYGPAFNYPSVQTFKDSGFTFISSPAVWNFVGPFPNFYYSYANIKYFTQEGYDSGAVGVMVSTWNDNGGAELRELNYPGYAWGADCAWDPDGASIKNFEGTFFHHYFGTSSDLPRIVYELLSSLNNQITWIEFWRPPFLKVEDRSAAVKTLSIKATMPEVLSLIKDAREVVHKNADILDIYELVAKMDQYWADRVSSVRQMRSISSDSGLTSEEKNKAISEIENRLLISIKSIKEKYTKIYLRTNRYPMLQLLEELFVNQEKGIMDGTRQMLAGNSIYNQKLQTQFIYYPGSRPYSHEGMKVDSASFVKRFDIQQLPDTAELQLIGDTYCRLYVNGDYIGDVKARRTLTLDVTMKRVKWFDIKKYLREGENTILVQCANYDRNGSAGCNILAVIGSDTVQSDSTWKAARGILSPSSYPGMDMVNAEIYDNGMLISAPNFSLKLKSWIER